MQPYRSRINTRSQPYQENYAQMKAVMEDWEKKMALGRIQGEDKYLDRHQKAGKLLPRDRVETLLDPDSPFLELMPLAGMGTESDQLGGQNIAGIGLVGGVETLVIANSATIKGGAMDHSAMLKTQRLCSIADENRLPVIYLVESAGAFLPKQAQVFNWFGFAFREIARRSKKGLPTISVVFGNSTAGGAYIPGMSDYSVMVNNGAKVFLAGPPLVKMATNEEVDDESLGGAKMHSSISGVSDYLAADEIDGLRIAREIMTTINHRKQGQPSPPKYPVVDPIYDPEEILGIASADVRIPFDAREVIARMVDGSLFHEFKPLYGSTLVTGWAQIHGFEVGILANNGILFSEAAQKGTHFIQLCNQSDVPLIYLQNITGFMVGKKYEEGGIIKDGAKLVNAVSNSSTPAITVIIGASYGAGNYAMSGLAYQPRFLFSWPNSRLAVMGPEQLAGVMDIITRDAAKKAGKPVDEAALGATRKAIEAQIGAESDPYYCTGRVWDDGVIDPRQTRNILGMSLSTLYSAPVGGENRYGVFRM